jgi:glutathione S-transferase
MGLAYEERLIGPEDQLSETYFSLQPFGQVPSYEEDGLVLFESGAIVLHIAERSDRLMPSGPGARARTKTWMFAALNTVLRILRRTGLVEEMPALNSYRLRCEARPAFQKALADQMGRFVENAPLINK